MIHHWKARPPLLLLKAPSMATETFALRKFRLME